MVAGAALPVQGAVNAQLRTELDAPIAADMPWWGWLGGLCGAVYVTSVFMLIPEIGAAPTVAGQQVASVFVDRFGLLRLPVRPVGRADSPRWRCCSAGLR